MAVLSLFTLLSVSLYAETPKALLQKPLVTAKQVMEWANPKTPNSARTVEGLLKKFPENYRKHFALAYYSNSNHTATPEYPRMIFFGPDAKLLTAVSGNPEDPAYGSVEMIEYEPDNAEYSFYRINFEENKKPTLEINPADCRSCHGGTQTKPNWEPYSLWPGVYGSLHDRIPAGSHENKNFAKFLQTYKSSSRYQLLPTPFYAEASSLHNQKDYYMLAGGVGPGASLSILATFLSRDKIAKQILKSAAHSRYRPAITAALIGCEQPVDSFLPVDLIQNHPQSYELIRQETETKMLQDFQRRIKHVASDLGVEEEFVIPHADVFGQRKSEVDRIAKLRFLLKNRKVGALDTDHWSLSLSKNALDFNDGVSGLENMAGHYLPLAYKENDPVRKAIRIDTVPFPFTSLGSEPIYHHGAPAADTYLLETYALKGNYREACELLLKEGSALSLH